MFDPRNFQPLHGVSEPTPDAKYREEYYHSRSHRKADPESEVKEQTVDVELLHAQMMTRIGRFFRFA